MKADRTFQIQYAFLIDWFATPDAWAIKYTEVKFTSSVLSKTACQELEIPELTVGVKNFKY